jgi:hypothetical protein
LLAASKRTCVAYARDSACSGELSGSAGMLRYKYRQTVVSGLNGSAAAGQEETYANNFAQTPSKFHSGYYLLCYNGI